MHIKHNVVNILISNTDHILLPAISYAHTTTQLHQNTTVVDRGPDAVIFWDITKD